MRAKGGSQGRRCELGGLCLSGVLLVGLASSAFAQGADKAKTDDAPKTDDSPVWTGESTGTRDRAPQWRSDFPRRVSGVVRLASGEAPYPPAEIFWCGQPVGSTDKKGRFNVPASRGGVSGFARRCYLSIHYPGTKSPRVSLSGGRLTAGYPIERTTPRSTRPIHLGTLVLEPLPGFEGTMTSVTTLEAPKAALRAYRKGMREEAKPEPDLDKAAARYEEAVALHPRFAEAWTALGRVRLGSGDIEGAAPALETAIAADHDFPAPRRMLLRIRMQLGELRPAAVIAAGLLRLTPGDDQTRYYHALATFGLQRYDEAAASAQALIDKGAGERFPQVFQILGEIYYDRGEIEAAARNFRSYLELAPEASSASQIRERLRDWGKVEPSLLTAKQPFTR